MYHRFGESKYPSTNITVEQLESHLNYLVEQNFRFTQASDLLDPEQQKEKTITVTIDDAYLSFYEVGLPIFEKHQVPVTLFLNTENVGGFNYMSWDQLRDVLDRGVEIQNHSHTHSSFSTLDEEAIINIIFRVFL
jgi:peptidoglycan/xylan/chitin deacetylase (PgdA/CDA1 family)